ncbi:YitT family protein [Ruminiclostridium papyrosolvens]|uniref:Membrane protein n=1 Tax=Ruminiclostridium papyrosolvens C7 TaxID=1330534 RepID=U4R3N2_9FIRM|nr:YitT family protein [Ruminiclostridium papyrosolvens]EPR12278.1 membrane protein [Ruminiclostridium papyrosolvens C7]
MKKHIMDFILINVGLLLVGIGICFFKIPNNFATGGVSGLAIIASSFFKDIDVGPMMLIINIVLLIVGFIFLGRDFGSKTMYSSFALSGIVWAIQKMYPLKHSLTDDMMLELIFSIIFPAIGSALVFNLNASTGGTDIVAKILSKHTNLNIGKTLLLTDFLIAAGAGAVFGIKIGMYSILGLSLKAFVIDLVMEGFNVSKQFVIISSKSDEIKEYIVSQLNRGATIYKAEGAFSHKTEDVISTVLNRRQAIKLRNYIRSIDDSAFITISNTSETIGKGFRSI